MISEIDLSKAIFGKGSGSNSFNASNAGGVKIGASSSSSSGGSSLRYGTCTTASKEGYVTVLMDGSDEPIVVGTSETLQVGDRVSVVSSNGSQKAVALGNNTIGGNMVNVDLVLTDKLTANEAFIKSLTASTAFIENLTANSAFIKQLSTDEAFVKSLTASDAFVTDLTANNAFVTKLTASDAFITKLSANEAFLEKLSVSTAFVEDLTGNEAFISSIASSEIMTDNLSAKFVKIDQANIDEAWVDRLMVQGSFVSQDGTVYNLTGLHVNAGDITTGTLTVDRIAVKSEVDGEYYMLTPNPEGGFTQVKLDGNIIKKDSINADRIIANSITTEQITTNNLVGTGGWINLANGTFKYSNAKTGGYISWDGAKLDMNVNSLTIGGLAVPSNEDVEEAKTAASNAQTAASNAQTAATNASTAASEAQSSASNASTAAQNAAANASNANSAAQTAATNASSANTAAQASADNASKAKTAAEDSKAAADKAEGEASQAKTEASQAKTAANDAKKVATNYLEYSASDGLLVGNKTSGTWSGYRSRMSMNGVDFLDGDGTSMSNFSDTVRVGKSNTYNVYVESTSIQLRNGSSVESEFKGHDVSLGANSITGNLYLAKKSVKLGVSELLQNGQFTFQITGNNELCRCIEIIPFDKQNMTSTEQMHSVQIDETGLEVISKGTSHKPASFSQYLTDIFSNAVYITGNNIIRLTSNNTNSSEIDLISPNINIGSSSTSDISIGNGYSTVTIRGNTLDDFIISDGSNYGWNWKKYKNRTWEATYNGSTPNCTIKTLWGYNYYDTQQKGHIHWPFTVSSWDVFVVSAFDNNGSVWPVYRANTADSNYTPNWYWVSGGSYDNRDVYYRIYAAGTY